MDSTHTQLATLLALRSSAKSLRVHRRGFSRSLSPISGLHHSKRRGRGIDFSEVREYLPGDDIRSIDWRVTARTGRPHTKLFREEQERPVFILIDQGPTLHFGSRRVFKSVLAAEAAALLGWATLNKGDRVGGIVCNGHQHKEVKPKRGNRSLLALLGEIESQNHNRIANTEVDTNYFSEALNKLRYLVKPGSTVYLISDFYNLNADNISKLRSTARHNDLVAVKVEDPLEHTPPPPGQYWISDGKQQQCLNLATSKHCNQFRTAAAARHETIAQLFGTLHVPLLRIQTALDCRNQLFEQLTRELSYGSRATS